MEYLYPWIKLTFIYVILMSLSCVNAKERLLLRRKGNQNVNGIPQMGNYRRRGTQNQQSTTMSMYRGKKYKSLLPTFKKFKYPGHNPPGYKHLNPDNVVSDHAGEEFACPDGYRKLTRSGVDYCSPTKTEDEIARIKERGCPGGADCVHSASIHDTPCNTGTHLIRTITGQTCETVTSSIHSMMNKLSIKKSINRQSAGKKTEAKLTKAAAGMPECDAGKVTALSQDGYICLDPVFPSSVCPEDLVPSLSPRGIRCVPCPREQRVIRSGDGIKCVGIVVTTDAPCPEGLDPSQTPVGRVCRYIPPSDARACPSGTTLRIVGGKKVCVDDSVCPPGQVKSEHGCVLPSKPDESYCLEGEVNYKGACIPIHLAGKFQTDASNPCVHGQVLVVTRSGSACQPMTDVRLTDSQHSTCVAGTILQQTLTGFQCRHGYLPAYIVPMCGLDFVFAKLGEMYECISRFDVELACAGDERIVRTDAGFVCTLAVTERDCYPEEFRYTDREDRTICIPHKQASKLCGDGYVAVRDGMHFMCKKLREDVICPSGYTLSLRHGNPLCIQDTGDCDWSMEPTTLCLNQIPHCQQGYILNLDSDETRCILETDHTFQVSEADIPQPCDAHGTVRPCDIPTETLLSGCNPDCANGGTCVNNSCICPPGVYGHACHIDLDECEGSPCEYACQNLFGSYHCTCPYDMTLRTDGRTCEDVGCIPECLNNGMCRRGRCTCSSGYEGTYCQTDKDECSVFGDRLCEYQCRNTNGGYQCICPPGSRLNQDGRTCLNTTCIPECRNGGLCRNHRCHCPRSFYGIVCQFDINECRTQRPCDHTCSNTRGSFVCSCKDGFILHTDRRTCGSV